MQAGDGVGYLEFAREALKDIYTFCISKCSSLTNVFMFFTGSADTHVDLLVAHAHSGIEVAAGCI